MVINSMSGVLRSIFGLHFMDTVIPAGKDNAILSYILSATFVAAFCLIVFIFQFLVVFSSEKGNVKMKIVSSIKRLGYSIFLIILIPIGMLLFALIFDQILLVFNNIWGSPQSGEGSEAGKSLAKLLFDVGYWGDLKEIPNTSGDTFGPPEYKYLIEYNFIIQILVVNFTMALLLYFGWNFLQKIIEIFILYITYPFAILSSIGTESINSSIWFKEILNKATTALLTILMYFVFSIFILAVDNSLIDSANVTKEKRILFTILLIATGFSIIWANIFVSRLFRQHSGFIGSYKSAKQTMEFSNKYISNNNNVSNKEKQSKKEHYSETINNENSENQFLKSIESSQKNGYYNKESTRFKSKDI